MRNIPDAAAYNRLLRRHLQPLLSKITILEALATLIIFYNHLFQTKLTKVSRPSITSPGTKELHAYEQMHLETHRENLNKRATTAIYLSSGKQSAQSSRNFTHAQDTPRHTYRIWLCSLYVI